MVWVSHEQAADIGESIKEYGNGCVEYGRNGERLGKARHHSNPTRHPTRRHNGVPPPATQPKGSTSSATPKKSDRNQAPGGSSGVSG